MGIGDDLIVTGMARIAQQSDPRKVRPMLEKGFRWSDVWRHNPRIVQPREDVDCQEVAVRIGGLRPYATLKTLRRWHWKEYRPPPGELYFSEQEQDYGRSYSGRVILEPHVKHGASPNKSWGWVRWNKLAWLLGKARVRVTQLGPVGTPILEAAEHVVTNDFRSAAAVLANARAVVVPEGGLHHAAAALGVPAIVIFGGFIAPAVTGYETQVNLFTGEGLGCGTRVPCECCRAAMAKITPERVAEQLLEMLRDGQRTHREAAADAA